MGAVRPFVGLGFFLRASRLCKYLIFPLFFFLYPFCPCSLVLLLASFDARTTCSTSLPCLPPGHHTLPHHTAPRRPPILLLPLAFRHLGLLACRTRALRDRRCRGCRLLSYRSCRALVECWLLVLCLPNVKTPYPSPRRPFSLASVRVLADLHSFVHRTSHFNIPCTKHTLLTFFPPNP